MYALATVTHATLAMRYDGFGHYLSQPQWEAVVDLAEHLMKAADGNIEHAVYLSAIPAGTAKSTTLTAFAEALMDDPNYEHVGMLIACNRIAEVYDFAKSLLAYRDKVCIIVGSERAAIQDGGVTLDVRSLGGHTEANKAQVVLTTQAALKSSIKGVKDFGTVKRYTYRGERRGVVCWDESIAFNRPVLLDAASTGSLLKAIRRQSAQAFAALAKWIADVGIMESGTITVPDFAELGVDFARLAEDVGANDELSAQVQALATVSGGKGYVVYDNFGSALVHHTPELPASLLPITVTDASAAKGVHHGAYEQMAKDKRIVRLKDAPKTYANLSLRVVPVAASRSVYYDVKTTRGLELIELAVRYIQSVQKLDSEDDRKVLVVSYKGSDKRSIKGVAERSIGDAIDARLSPEDRQRVRHVTWGQHTATNRFTKARHVILMGLHFQSGATAYAASGAIQGKPMNTDNPEDHPTEDDVEVMRVGHLRDSTLQAVLRGHARMGVKGDCGVMESVILQSRQTGLSKADYLGMFPRANWAEDHSLSPAKPLKGNLLKLSQIVAARVQAGDREMTNPSLYEAMKMAHGNFYRLVKRPEWHAWLDAMALRPCTLQGGIKGLRAFA